MSFTQIIELDGVSDEQALHTHLATWDAEQSGVAPGYLGCRILADNEAPGRYVVEVDFSSEEEAKRNNDRPETEAWAAKTRELASGDPTYRNLRQVCTTYA
jgi:quinol monooxygenase YgiN